MFRLLRPHRSARWYALVVPLAILTGCSDRLLTPPAASPSLSVETAPGVFVTAVDMQQRLTRLTRALAVALGGSDALRARLWAAVEQSPFPEGKLEYRALLDQDGFGLLEGMAEAARVGPERLRAMSDSILDLEVYLPVDDHRARWDGDGDLIVASLFDDEPRYEVVGFDLSGRAVRLDPDSPPDRPTLVLVPSETDFAASPPEPAKGGQSSHIPNDGLFMTASYLPDLHEPWPKGDPEIYVHVAVENTVTDIMEWKSCAGDDHDTAAFKFDQNNSSWNGPDVQIASDNVVVDKDFEIFVWEDDDDRCDGVNHLKPKEDVDALDDIALSALKAGAEVVDLGPGDKFTFEMGAAFAQVAYDLFQAVRIDDMVGITHKLSGLGCFTTLTGPVMFLLRDQNDNLTSAWIKIDDNFTERVLCPVSVEIQGPTQLLDCPGGFTPPDNYWGSVQSGQGTTSWQWKENGVVRSTASTYNLFASSPTQVQLILKVTKGSEVAYDTLYVDIDAPENPEEDCLA